MEYEVTRNYKDIITHTEMSDEDEAFYDMQKRYSAIKYKKLCLLYKLWFVIRIGNEKQNIFL